MEEVVDTKECSKCKTVKVLADYYKNKKTKDGLLTVCKDCHNARVKANLQKKKEALVVDEAPF